MSDLLQFVWFKGLDNWNVKQYLSSLITSNQEIVKLSKYIEEEKTKIKPFESPKNDFKILGVNNKVGLFDNEIKKGSEINQPYKIVENGFLAFNPYRINVGSIGLKSNKQQNDLISPAYVVFSCKEGLLPEYLFMIFKTNIFNQIIKDNTKGSVRQILSFDVLERLQIPLPPLEIQQKIVKNYQDKLNLAKQQTEQTKQKEAEIETYLYQKLGIELPKEEKQNTDILQFVRFEYLHKWTVKDLLSNCNTESSIYETIKFSQLVLKKPMYGSNSRGKKEITDTRYIRITDINENGTLNSEVVSSEKTEEKYLLKQNDFLIARSGNTVGKTFLYDEKYGRCMYAGYLIKFIINDGLINLQYLIQYTKSGIYKEWIKSNLRAAGQPNINSQEYLDSPIILPPLKIQNQIANHIQNIKNEIQALKQQAEQNQNDALNEFEAEIFTRQASIENNNAS